MIKVRIYHFYDLLIFKLRSLPIVYIDKRASTVVYKVSSYMTSPASHVNSVSKTHPYFTDKETEAQGRERRWLILSHRSYK